MKRIRSMPVSLTLMACLGMIVPQAAIAEVAVANRQAVKTLDVKLHDAGVFVGQVVTPEGKVKQGIEVIVLQMGQERARATTDKMGRFAVKGLNGGAYHVATTSGQIPFRAWTKDAAPPQTALGVLLVDGTTVRGQCNCKSGASAGYGGEVLDPDVSYTTSYNGASFNQGGSNYEIPAANDQAASFNQGTANYDAGSTYYNDAGATYVDGSSGFYDASGGAACQGNCGGQCHGGGGLFGLGLLGHGGAAGGGGVLASSPLLIGGAVAAAIAIPVALNDDDDDAS